jgi:hypothetical protein
MPNATVRANARTTPNAPPKPGAAPSALTKATVNLENSVEMLKELRGVADKERVPFAVESAVLDVKIWASTACLLWQETRWSNQLMRIPMKPAMHSNRKPATDSDLKPAGVPI